MMFRKLHLLTPCVAWGMVMMPMAYAGTVEVLLPDGSPASGATVAAVAKAGFLHIKNGGVIHHYGDPLSVLSEDGRMTISDADAGRWVFLHPLGWADVNVTAETRTISLGAWNIIRGEIDRSVKREDSGAVSFSRIEAPSERGGVYWTSEVPVNDDGTFVMHRVPSGRGTVGIVREFKNDRRVQRWKDYPVALAVPHGQPVHLGGEGVEVRGRVAAATDERRSLATITDRTGRRPPYFGVTSADGTLVIPGVLPGDYQIALRRLDDKSGRSHVQRGFSVASGDGMVDLGELGDPPPNVEIYRGVEYSEGLIERVREAAQRQYGGRIQKIQLGQLVHPLNMWGARVVFEPEPMDDTHAMARTFLVKIPGETIRKFYPEHDTEGYGYRFTEGEFFDPRLLEESVRLFPLKSQTLALAIEDPLDYETALALLKTIEAGTWKEKAEPKGNKGGWVGGSGIHKIKSGDLSRIYSIRRAKPGGPIHVMTKDQDFGGTFSDYEEKDGEFILLGGGGWRS